VGRVEGPADIVAKGGTSQGRDQRLDHEPEGIAVGTAEGVNHRRGRVCGAHTGFPGARGFVPAMARVPSPGWRPVRSGVHRAR
jgi:hypothetical protein